MTSAPKDTIYIDVDDEITSIIEKVQKSEHKIVALVLPKRAAVLQSIVNMRLLKRAADDAKKSLVLITSETGLLPLAGAAGVFTAKTLQSKPEVPPPPESLPAAEAVVNASPETEPDLDKSAPVGVLAGLPASKEETIEVDNDPETDDKTTVADKAKAAKTDKSKKFKIPNFEKFRLRLALVGGGLLLLIIGWLVATMVLPRAKITVKAEATSLTTSLELNANTNAKELDLASRVVPAAVKTVKKNAVQKVPTTGQKNVGEQAKGTMTVYNCTDNNITLPAGTAFTNNNLAFGTDQEVLVPASDFFSNGNCKKNRAADVAVTAGGAGDNYNLSAGRSYTSNFASTVTGIGTAMSGGTSKLVPVVAAVDIDSAKQKFTEAQGGAADELKKALNDEQFLAVVDTLEAATPTVTSTPKVGEEGTEVTVSGETAYSMLGVKTDELNKLVQEDAKLQIDTSKQQIQDTGVQEGVFRVLEKKSPGDMKLSLQTIVEAGAQLNADELKRLVAGKKRGQAQELIGQRPGIKDVTVEYSPFWVLSTPKRTNQITIIFEKIQ